jgi:hypothetical protein
MSSLKGFGKTPFSVILSAAKLNSSVASLPQNDKKYILPKASQDFLPFRLLPFFPFRPR